MSDKNLSSKIDFNISSRDDEEQKREYKIDNIRDQTRRENLLSMRFNRDVTLEREASKFIQERERITHYILDGSVKPDPSMNLDMSEVRKLPESEQLRVVNDAVVKKKEPEQKAAFESLRSDINENIDKEIEKARGAEIPERAVDQDAADREQPKLSSAEEKLEQLRENKRDITQSRGASLGQTRGRSQ